MGQFSVEKPVVPGLHLSGNQQHALPAARGDEVRVLLERYRCPIPFHAIRTRFLGGIASPLPLHSLMHAVKALWGGELPACGSLDDVNELLAALVMRL